VNEKIANTPGMGETLFAIATIYYESGSFDEALYYYQASVEKFAATGDRNAQASALNNAAGALIRSGRRQEAVNHLESITSLFPGSLEFVTSGQGHCEDELRNRKLRRRKARLT
jgi:tetratricopeptide (TPR) repeat protein